MEHYGWSAKNNAFFPMEMIEDYVGNDWDVSDIVEVHDSVFAEFTGVAPTGKVRGVDDNGMPCWVDIPPPSNDELIAHADAKKLSLQRNAEDVIKPLDRAKQLGIATDTELALLFEWEKYSVFLMRVDTSTAPDINWPQQPAE
ncbi:MAG: tail fiber assembly protein [Plesiomonas shigelloides]